MTIPLLDKDDAFQVIGTKIAEYLAAEILLQQGLAVTEGEDVADYTFKVYRERIKPWEMFLQGTIDATPIVNVWYSGGVPDEGKSSDVTGHQRVTSRYNIDVCCYAIATETQAGHSPGDELAALKAHRVTMLVRNILMHDDYRVLKMTKALGGRVWKRWISDITPFQPQSNGAIIQDVIAVRLELRVEHDEYIMQADEETCEAVDIVFKHEPDGMVIASITVGAPAPAPEEPPEEPGD
jgi:hypothetical protein